MRMLGTVRCFVARRPHLDWWIVPTGVGPERATATAQRVIAEQPFAAVWSTGFACALRTASIGDVLIGTQITAEREPGKLEACQCDPSMVERAQQGMQHQFVPVQVGPFVSVPHVLCRAEEKRDMAARAAAVGLDMESAALGMVAAEWKIPFGIIRTVSDLVDEDLPLDFNLFLRPSGWAKGMASCLAHPTALLGLNRLRGQSRIAGAQLTAVFRALTDQAGVGAMV
jgi:adenosylhomocysteine nucleosidase